MNIFFAHTTFVFINGLRKIFLSHRGLFTTFLFYCPAKEERLSLKFAQGRWLGEILRVHNNWSITINYSNKKNSCYWCLY